MTSSNTLTSEIYEHLRELDDGKVSIRELFQADCPGTAVYRMIGADTDAHSLSGPQLFRREYDKRLRAKMREIIQRTYPSPRQYNAERVTHKLMMYEDESDGELMGVPLYIAVVGFDEFKKAYYGQFPPDVIATASLIGREEDAVSVLLIDRNTQRWSVHTAVEGVAAVAEEALMRAKDLVAMTLGIVPLIGVSSAEECAACPFVDECEAFNGGRVVRGIRPQIDISSLSFETDKGIMADLDATVLEMDIEGQKWRPDKVFHPSEVSNFSCDRRQAYSLLGARRGMRKGRQLLRIFLIGHIIHDIIQEALVARIPGFRMEIKGKLETQRLEGHIDGVEPDNTVIEIKSMGTKTWESATKPKKEHLDQATMYARMQGSDKLRFLYLNKDTGQLRELVTRFDRKTWHRIADRLETIIKTVSLGDLPAQIESGECEECPFYDKCKRRRHHHG